MEKGLKLGLIIGGGVLLVAGGVFAIVKLSKKEDTKDGGNDGKVGGDDSKNSNNTTLSKDGKSYQLVEIGSGIRNPIVGETMFALQDCTIEMSNHPNCLKKNYEEYTRSHKAGDTVGVAYWVSGNKIIIDKDYNQRALRYQHIIKQNENNAKKLGVFRDVNGNPLSLESNKKFFDNVKNYLKSDDGKAVVKDLATKAVAKSQSKNTTETKQPSGKLPDGTTIFVPKN